MATLFPELPNYKRKSDRRKKHAGHILPDDIRYTSLRAQKACSELGIPTNYNKEHRPRGPNPRKTSRDFVTSYCRSLRTKNNRKNPAVATIVIGRHRSDYVTTTSQCLPIVDRDYHKEHIMTRNRKKENHQSKPASKQVTFNDDIEVEEFRSHDIIMPKTKTAEKSNRDVIKDNIISNGKNVKNNRKSDVTKEQTKNDKTIGDNDETNKSNNECDATDTPANVKKDATTKRTKFPTSTDNLIPLKSPIEQKISLSDDTQLVIEKESGQESIPELNAILQKQNGISTNAETDGTEINTNETCDRSSETGEPEKQLDLNEDTNGNESMDNINALSGEEKTKIYTRKHLKKHYSDIGNNLPIIREESSSRLTHRVDVTMKSYDVNNDVDQKEEDNTLLTRDEVIKKVKEDARLSALKGQVAADKAAWSCVVRYPRRVTSLPVSRNASPSNIDVTYDVTRPGSLIFQNEKNNTFPLNSGKKLTIYQHNFGQKYRVTNSPTTLPPLLTSPTNDANLVTQRRSGVWVPDLSIVPRAKRHRVRTKGSKIVMYDSDK